MKIFPFADYASDWYPRNAMELFKKYSHTEFVSHPRQADLVWIFSYYAADALYALPPLLYSYIPLPPQRNAIFRAKPVITTLHHLTPEKEALWKGRITRLDHVTDAWQTFSKINYPFFQKFLKKPIHILPYWIDTTVFFSKPADERAALRRNLGLPAAKKIYGSFQRDTEADGMSPKLEKGPDIFCDIIEQLNPADTYVLLAGPRREYIERRLTKKNILYQSLGKVSYDKMNDLYNTLDYYLVSSRYEGGPQAILECLATGTKLLSTPVGIADILSSSIIFRTPAEAVLKVKAPYPNVLDQHLAIAKAHDCQVVVPQFERFFATFMAANAH